MEKLLDLLPIIVGALIAIVPTLVSKYLDKKYIKEASDLAKKQDMYIKLITQIGEILTDLKTGVQTIDTKKNVDSVRTMINVISIIGSGDVVKALNDYIDTWGNVKGDNQTIAYTEFLRAIRVDLKIDKGRNADFPEIGLRDINFK